MAYTSPTFSGATSSTYTSETAAASSHRCAMSHRISRRLYNYRLHTYEPERFCTEGSSHQHTSASQRVLQQQQQQQQQHSAVDLRAASHQRVTRPRRHPGVLLPEASASQHQAVYLEYLRLVATGKLQDPSTPPSYETFDDEEEPPRLPPPTYEQAVKNEPDNAVRGMSGGMMIASHQSAQSSAPRHPTSQRRAIQTQAPAQTPAIQALSLVQVNTPIPTNLPPRPRATSKLPTFLSRIAGKFRASKGT